MVENRCQCFSFIDEGRKCGKGDVVEKELSSFQCRMSTILTSGERECREAHTLCRLCHSGNVVRDYGPRLNKKDGIIPVVQSWPITR